MDTTTRIPYRRLTVDLAQARDREEIMAFGRWDYILVESLSASNPVYLHINHPDADPIRLVQGKTIKCPPEFLRRSNGGPPIRRLYLTNSAEDGGELALLLGGDAGFEVAAAGVVQVVDMNQLIAEQDETQEILQQELQRAITGVDLSGALASTDTPLANGASWVSGWFAVDRYARVVLTALADQEMELRVEFSWDQATVHAVEVLSYPKTGGALGEGDGYEVEVVAPWARIRATNNSGADQTSLAIRAGGRVI